MNSYQLRKYLRYRWQAKGRHGVHSPFVYRFIEEGLNKPLPRGMADGPQARVDHYFPVQRQLEVSATGAIRFLEKSKAPDTVWQLNEPATEAIHQFLQQPTATPPYWYADRCRFETVADAAIMKQQLHRLLPFLHAQSFLIVPGIHAHRAATLAWQELSHDAAITLSIDLFQLGLLFIDPAIKEQQHFVLKCPQ